MSLTNQMTRQLGSEVFRTPELFLLYDLQDSQAGRLGVDATSQVFAKGVSECLDGIFHLLPVEEPLRGFNIRHDIHPLLHEPVMIHQTGFLQQVHDLPLM